MKVVVAGESPFVEDITQLCVTAGHDTRAYLVEELGHALASDTMAEDLVEAEVVIEIHNQALKTKATLLEVIGAQVPVHALVLASALSSSVTLSAAYLPHPERVVGFVLMSPLRDENVVELASALQTDEMAMGRATEFWRSLGCSHVLVGDGPGLVRARVICCLINEAVDALAQGVATEADIDQAMKLGTNYPLGPMEWADHLGLDTVLGVMEGLHEETGEDRYRPSALLRRMVAAGRLGKKSGRGFYQYG